MGQTNIVTWVACYTTMQTMVVMNSIIAANVDTCGHTQIRYLPPHNNRSHNGHPIMPATRNTSTINTTTIMMSGGAGRHITIENIHAVEVVAAHTHDDDAVYASIGCKLCEKAAVEG